MKLSSWEKRRQRFVQVFLLTILVFQFFPFISYAQNLGAAPATGQAVQGQTAAAGRHSFEFGQLGLQRDSSCGAALAVVMAVVAYSQGRGVERWAVTAGGLLVVSGLTRLIEFWIQNGTAGVQ